MRSRAVGSLVGVLGPAAAALALWVVGAPRAEGVSIGEGRALMFPDAGRAGGTQLLVLLILLGFAVVCAVLVLWHRHPELRRPRGVVALAGLPALTCAIAAAAASPLADVIAAPSSALPRGAIVALPPEVGPLFFGRMVYGVSGPVWGALPAGLGWFVFGAMVAAFVVAALAHLSESRDLVDAPAGDVDGSLREDE